MKKIIQDFNIDYIDNALKKNIIVSCKGTLCMEDSGIEGGLMYEISDLVFLSFCRCSHSQFV